MNKLDQFSECFSIVPITDVVSVSNNEYSLTDPNSEIKLIADNDILISQQANRSDSGVQYNISTTINIKTDNRLMVLNSLPAIVVLKTLRNRQKVWGNKDFPVIINVQPSADSYLMSIHLRSTSLVPII